MSSGTTPDSDSLDKDRVSVMIADIKDYSRLSNNHLESFFTEVLADIADTLNNYNTLSQNSWGDGIIAFFPEESDAVECAFEIRKLFYNFSSNKYNLPDTDLDIRIALHTAWVWKGTNPVRSESGFVGSDIALAARIEPIAMPNRIFATESFATLIPDSVRQDNNIEIDRLYAVELAKGWGAEELCHIRRENWTELTKERLQKHHEKIKSEEDTDSGAIQIMLESDDPKDKKKAIDILAKRGDKKSMERIENLATEREDTLADVRSRAIGRLDEFSDPRIIDTLIDVVENDEYHASVINAVACLGNLGVPRAYDTLANILESSDAYNDKTRQNAAAALGDLNEPQAVDALARHLDPEIEDSIQVRRRAVSSLSRLGDVRATEPLINHSLDDFDKENRIAAIEALAELGDKRAVEPLSEIVKEPEKNPSQVRISAIASLVSLGEYKAIDPLIQSLNDPSDDIKVAAVMGLGELDATSAIDEIESILKDTDNKEELRAACATSLGQIGHHNSKQAIIESLKDPSVNVRNRAIQAIGQGKIVDALPHLVEILNSPDKNVSEVRKNAALAIGDLGQADGLPALKEGIDNVEEEVQRAIAQSAGFIDTPEARQFLIELLESDKPVPVRAMAAKALGSSSDDTVSGPLLDILDSDYEHRMTKGAVIALGSLSVNRASIRVAEIACESTDSELRRRALLTLQVIPDPAIAADIYNIIDEKETIWDIDRMAMNVLRAIGTPESTQYLEQINEERDNRQRVIHANQLLQVSPKDVRDDAKETIESIYNNFESNSQDEG